MQPLRKLFGLTPKASSEVVGEKKLNRMDKKEVKRTETKDKADQKVNKVGVGNVGASEGSATHPIKAKKGIKARFKAFFGSSKKSQVEKAPPGVKVVKTEVVTPLVTPELRKAWIAGALAASEAVSARMEKGKIPDGFFRLAANTGLSNKFEAELKKGNSIQDLLEGQNVPTDDEEAQMNQLASYLKKSLVLLAPSISLLTTPLTYDIGKEAVKNEIKVLVEDDPEGVKKLLSSLADLINKGIENEHSKTEGNKTKMTPEAFGKAVPSIFPLLTDKAFDEILPNNRYGFPVDEEGRKIEQNPPALVLLTPEQLFFMRHNEKLEQQKPKTT